MTDLGEHTGCHSREIMTINTNAGCSQDELDPARRRVSTDALGGLRALKDLRQSPTLQIHQHCLLRTFPMAYSTGQVVLNELPEN